MTLRNYVLLLLTFWSNSVFSQSNQLPIDSTLWQNLYHREFSRLITEEGLNAGNYASINMVDQKVEFGISKVFKSGSILTFNGSGKTNEGFLPILKNKSISSALSLGVRMDFLNKEGPHSISLRTQDRKKYQRKIFDINKKYQKDTLATSWKEDKNAINQKITQIQRQLNNRINQYSGLPKPSTTQTQKFKKDTQQLRITIDSLKFEHHIYNWPSAEKVILNNERIKAEEEAFEALEVFGFNYTWLSIGLSFKSESFNLFNRDAGDESEFSETTSYVPTFSMQLNKNKKGIGTRGNYFWSATMEFSGVNNLNTLEEINKEIRDTNIVNNSNAALISTKQGYEGEFDDMKFQMALSWNAFYFLKQNRSIGIHILPRLQINDNLEDNLSLMLGCILALQDKKDKSSNANIEIAFKFQDLTDVVMPSKSFFEKIEAGLQFSFPIDF